MKKEYFAHLPIFLGLILVLLFSLSTHAEVTDEELDSILNSPPQNFSQNYWSQGVTAYLSSCQGGSCSCVFGITEALEVDTGMFWFGNFARGSADEMYLEYGRINTNTYNGGFARKLDKCHAANQTMRENSSGDCCMQFEAGAQCVPCQNFQNYAASLGITENQTKKHLWYGSTLKGAIYIHDNAHCEGPRCTLSVACPTVSAAAMKDLCKKYIGQYPKRAALPHSFDNDIVTEESAGGVWYYFNGGSRGSREAAKKGLAVIKERCASEQYGRLGNMSGSNSLFANSASSNSRNQSSRSYGNDRGGDSSGSSSGTGSGGGSSIGDFLSNFINELISADAQSRQADQEGREAGDSEKESSRAVVSRSELNNNCSLINGVKLCDEN